MNKKGQVGVGMVEILVALLILAIAVLGFTALQLRAISSTDEALQKVSAMNLARDLAERIRANRISYNTYSHNLSIDKPSDKANACLGALTCTSVDMANYDTAQILNIASNLGMRVSMQACQVSGNIGRQCIYVSWNKTLPKDAKDVLSEDDKDIACTNGGTYQPTASCIVMELY